MPIERAALNPEKGHDGRLRDYQSICILFPLESPRAAEQGDGENAAALVKKEGIF